MGDPSVERKEQDPDGVNRQRGKKAPFVLAQFLFRNTGKVFTDVTRESGIDENNNRYSFAAAWCDFNEDGRPELYVANDFGRNNLYKFDANIPYTYSDMNGYGHFLPRLRAFNAYYAAWAFLLAIAAYLFWTRGTGQASVLVATGGHGRTEDALVAVLSIAPDGASTLRACLRGSGSRLGS